MIKLVASDVDGTLIKDSTPDLYPEMAKAIKRLKKAGIIFCAASGRQYASLRNVFRESADDIAYIAENGAHIRYLGENIMVTAMQRDYAERIVEELRSYSATCDIIVSTPNGSLVESTNQEYLDLLIHGYHNEIRQVKDVLATGEELLKVSIYRKGSIRDLGESVLIPKWKDKVKCCMAGDEWVDYMDASVDKGKALKLLQQHIGIDKQETMAFGDNNNDIGMMQAAGESYAVENARKEVKTHAKYICPSWQNKGVYKMIKKLYEA